MTDFPADALPPFLSDVVLEVATKTQAPYSMVASTALVVMAEAAQGSYDVEIPSWGPTPLSLNIAIIADSGTGKSVVLKLLRAPIVTFENDHTEEYREQHEIFLHRTDSWTAERDAVKSKFKKNVIRGQPTEALEIHLADLAKRKPKKPRKIQLSYSDVTPTAIKQGMSENWPNCCVVTGEGSTFFQGRMKSDWGVWNDVWDSNPIIVNRKDEEILIQRPRLTFLIMVQHGPFKRYLEAHGEDYRDVGSLARFLFCAPQSNQGWRFRSGEDRPYVNLDVFHKRLTDSLSLSISATGDPVGELRVIRFSEAAKEHFFSIHNDIEQAQQPGGWLSNACDHASKITRNLARIAALLQIFGSDKPTVEISLDTLTRAVSISSYFTDEFLRLFIGPPKVPKQFQDAEALYTWMLDFSTKHQLRYVLKCDVQKYCPYALRKKEISDAAISVLVQQNRLSSWILGKISYFDMCPAYLYDAVALEHSISESRSRRKPVEK